MHYDQQKANILLANLNEAHRTIKLLQSSLQRLASIMPLSIENNFSNLDAEDLDRLDAFRVRFADIGFDVTRFRDN